MILDFLNKNMYRKYPLRGDMTCRSIEGVLLPSSLISSLKLTLPPSINSVFIKKVSTSGNYVAISIANEATGNELGTFKGTVVGTQTTLALEPRPGLSLSGFMTIGELPLEFGTATQLNFSSATSLVEPSCLFLFTPPAVTALVDDRDNVSNGSIALVTDNLSLISEPGSFSFEVINKASTLTNADFSGVYRNCQLPVITHINTVTPDVNGNIDIYGIEPLSIGVDNINKAVDLETELEITDVCPDLNKISPPTNASVDYYTDILTAPKPEWQTWPRYAD